MLSSSTEGRISLVRGLHDAVKIHNVLSVNGNNQKWDGGGPFYWVNTSGCLRELSHVILLQDGQGTNGGVTKPHPMMQYAHHTLIYYFFSTSLLPA